MDMTLSIQSIFLQSAQGGGSLLVIIFLILIGIVIYVEKRKSKNSTQETSFKSQGDISRNNIIA